MSGNDPTRTVHFVMARMLARRFGGDTPSFAEFGDSLLAWSIASEYADAAGRLDYIDLVNYAWALCCLACFSIAGSANALWRKLYAHAARRRARSNGLDSPRYAAAMRRALPRNSSLISQGIVGVAAAFITASTW